MRIYFSGWQATNKQRELAVVQAGAIKHRCFSFSMVNKLPGMPWAKGMREALSVDVKHDIGIMMDSGVFSYRTHKKKGAKGLIGPQEFVDWYVRFVQEHGKKWDWYVTVDFEKNAEKIFVQHLELEKMGLRPTPVFHGDTTVDFLQRYVDRGYDLVCIGSSIGARGHRDRRHYLDDVFNRGAKWKIRFHGLGIVAAWQMLEYPWWSVDASSWSRAAGYGCLLRYDENKRRMTTLHVSDRFSQHHTGGYKQNAKAVEFLREILKSEGYDYKQLQTDLVLRHIYNGRTFLRMAEVADKQHGSGGWQLLF